MAATDVTVTAKDGRAWTVHHAPTPLVALLTAARRVPMTDTVREALQELPRPLDLAAAVLPAYADPHVLTRSFSRLVPCR